MWRAHRQRRQQPTAPAARRARVSRLLRRRPGDAGALATDRLLADHPRVRAPVVAAPVMAAPTVPVVPGELPPTPVAVGEEGTEGATDQPTRRSTAQGRPHPAPPWLLLRAPTRSSIRTSRPIMEDRTARDGG